MKITKTGYKLGMNANIIICLLLLMSAVNIAYAQEMEKSANDPAQLHSAFKFTGEDIAKWIKRGDDAAKRGKSDRLFETSRKQPVWTRGKKGRSNATVNLWEWQGMKISYDAFDASRKYEKINLPESIIKDGNYFKWISFGVILISEPKVDFRGGKIAAALQSLGGNTVTRKVVGEADINEVTVVKIVLTDGKGNVLVANDKDTTSEVKDGNTTFRGVDVQRSTETENATASAYGNGGYAYGSGVTTYRRENLIPYSENYKYFEARYSVRFPLFNDKGEPLIKEDVKEITLRIITEAGEMSVTYKLSDFKK